MFAWLAKILGGVFSLKTFFAVLFMSILGIIFYNLICDVVLEVMNFTIAQISGQSYGSVTSPSISGFSGWVASQCKIPECVSVMGSFTALKFILKKIPFLNW